jgi:hypothetical protein
MKTLMTVPVKVETSSAMRQSRLVHFKITPRKGLLKRFRHFIESTDWEEYLCHEWIDRIGLGVIIASIIYFCFHTGAHLTEVVFRNFG